jgi:hypothetical protein
MPDKIIEDPSLEDIASPVLADFFSLWQAIQGEHHRPRLKDFSLTDFAAHLPHMALNDYDRKTGRFHVRLFGSSYVDGIGGDLTGAFVDEVPNTEVLLKRYRRLVESKQAYLSLDNDLSWSPNDFQKYSVLACPLFDADENVATLMFRIEFIRLAS